MRARVIAGTGMVKVSSASIDKRLELIFTVYDQDGDGHMELYELYDFLLSAMNDSEASLMLAQEALELVDKDGSGTITKEVCHSPSLQCVCPRCAWCAHRSSLQTKAFWLYYATRCRSPLKR